MEDIMEIAKRMTRSEFMNWYEDSQMLECPSSFKINSSSVDNERCIKHDGDCLACVEEAVKDIKFKDEKEDR